MAIRASSSGTRPDCGYCLICGPSDWSESRARPLRPALHRAGCTCGCERGIYLPPTCREDCPNGCGHRDLRRERELGLNRICLRCFCWTHDPEHWRIRATPLMVKTRPEPEPAKVAATRRERRSNVWRVDKKLIYVNG